jgi:hypothetical protein
MLGSITDTLTLTGEYAHANDFEVWLRAFNKFFLRLVPMWRKPVMGGINFG